MYQERYIYEVFECISSMFFFVKKEKIFISKVKAFILYDFLNPFSVYVTKLYLNEQKNNESWKI